MRTQRKAKIKMIKQKGYENKKQNSYENVKFWVVVKQNGLDS